MFHENMTCIAYQAHWDVRTFVGHSCSWSSYTYYQYFYHLRLPAQLPNSRKLLLDDLDLVCHACSISYVFTLVAPSDVIDRCQPVPGSQDPVYGLSNHTICTQMNLHILNDGFRSFPSGHSSCKVFCT
jgi:membrane-associated phospholipid phosphatase